MRNKVLIEKPNFHVDEANKVVVCTLECDMQLHKHPAWNAIDYKMFKSIPYVGWDGKFIVKAKASCNATDTFNVGTGKMIAERFNVTQIEIPEKWESKDPSDVVKNHGREVLRQIIYELVNNE